MNTLTPEKLDALFATIPQHIVPEHVWKEALGETHHTQAQRLIEVDRTHLRSLAGMGAVLMAALVVVIIAKPMATDIWMAGLVLLALVGGLVLYFQKNKSQLMLSLLHMAEREEELLKHGWTMDMFVWATLEELVQQWDDPSWVDKLSEVEEHGWSKPPLDQQFWLNLRQLIEDSVGPLHGEELDQEDAEDHFEEDQDQWRDENPPHPHPTHSSTP